MSLFLIKIYSLTHVGRGFKTINYIPKTRNHQLRQIGVMMTHNIPLLQLMRSPTTLHGGIFSHNNNKTFKLLFVDFT